MSRSGTRDALSGFLGESRAEVAPNVRRSRATLALTLILDLEVRSPFLRRLSYEYWLVC